MSGGNLSRHPREAIDLARDRDARHPHSLDNDGSGEEAEEVKIIRLKQLKEFESFLGQPNKESLRVRRCSIIQSKGA